jgi:cytochrome P450
MTATLSPTTPSHRQPPGPLGNPILGMLPELQTDKLNMYRNVTRDYGDVVTVRFLWVKTYAVSHPDHVKHILQDNNRNYVRNTFFNGIMKLILQDNLFTTDGDDWLSRRRLMQPSFHRQHISGFGDIMTDSVGQMLDQWDARSTSQPLDVDHEMMELTLRVAGRSLFSVDLVGQSNELGEAFTTLSKFIDYRLNTPFPPPLWVPTAINRRYKAALKLLDETIYKMIRERRASGEDAGDLLSMLLNAKDADTGEMMSEEQARNEVVTLMFAGHETTAAALSWALYFLSQHPEAEAKLLAELSQVLGGRTATVADLPNLKYTRMVVDETLRLVPPAFGMTRQNLEADEIGGYTIPRNSSVTVLINNIHHDPRWWTDPEKFDPDRFTPERSEGRPNYAFMPFGGGPRLCIGNTFALTEAVVLLASIVQRCQLQLVPGHVVKANPIFVTRTNGLPMIATKR